jgi:hypothetical protein
MSERDFNDASVEITRRGTGTATRTPPHPNTLAATHCGRGEAKRDMA